MEAKIARMQAGIKQFLRNRHISVPNDWLHDCIQFIYEDDGPQLTSQADWLKDLPMRVYEQWLATNLNDLNTPCLPNNLANDEKITFEGHFALQVNSMLDISQPAFKQLNELKGVDRSNAEVTAEKVSQPKNAKAHRMLKLEMTDGVQKIAGMEYQAIPSLNVSLPPGVKVLVFGKLECRRGMLLLTSENICVLGGEVSELGNQNGQLQLLNQVLQITPDDANHTVELTEDPDLPRTNSNVAAISDLLDFEDWENMDGFDDRELGQRPAARTPLTEINTSSTNPSTQTPAFDFTDMFEDEDENAFQ